jgi:hypothetical protein
MFPMQAVWGEEFEPEFVHTPFSLSKFKEIK